MGNGKHLEAFSLDSSQLHSGRADRQLWHRQTLDIRQALQSHVPQQPRYDKKPVEG